MAKSSISASRVLAAVKPLREAIFEGRFPPGSPLRELTLARELNVSQATIREALQRLEHAGLVTRTPNVGTTVTRLAPKDVRERVALRALLEITAAQSASPRMTEDDYAELSRRLHALAQAVESNRYYEAAQADLDFHRFVWQCSGNETLCRVLELVTVPLFAFISIMRSQGFQKLASVVAGHEPLIAALRSGDPLRIQTAFHRGATSSYETFLEGGTPSVDIAQAFGYLDPSSPA